MTRFPKNDIASLIAETPRYDLAESVGPDLRLDDLLGDSERLDIPLSYGTAAGNPGLRKHIANLYEVEPDDVVITVGSMHTLFLTAFILCDPGDEAVTTVPSFPLAHNALKAVGADVRVLRLSFDRGYQLNPQELDRQLSERTKLVSLATPQNPSGVAVSPDAIREVAALMEARCPDACLLLDQAYREAAYGNDPTASGTFLSDTKVIYCASLSKCHGAPGLRMGWAITRDAALREQLVLGKFNTVICCSPVDEALALQVLQRRERILDDRRRHLAEGLAATADWVRENKAFVDWVRPDAGALCCVRLKAQFDDAAVRRFYDGLVEKGVRVANGAWFGEEARVFRLGFGLLPVPDLRAALDILSTVLKQAAHEQFD